MVEVERRRDHEQHVAGEARDRPAAPAAAQEVPVREDVGDEHDAEVERRPHRLADLLLEPRGPQVGVPVREVRGPAIAGDDRGVEDPVRDQEPSDWMAWMTSYDEDAHDG